MLVRRRTFRVCAGRRTRERRLLAGSARLRQPPVLYSALSTWCTWQTNRPHPAPNGLPCRCWRTTSRIVTTRCLTSRHLFIPPQFYSAGTTLLPVTLRLFDACLKIGCEIESDPPQRRDSQ